MIQKKDSARIGNTETNNPLGDERVFFIVYGMLLVGQVINRKGLDHCVEERSRPEKLV